MRLYCLLYPLSSRIIKKPLGRRTLAASMIAFLREDLGALCIERLAVTNEIVSFSNGSRVSWLYVKQSGQAVLNLPHCCRLPRCMAALVGFDEEIHAICRMNRIYGIFSKRVFY